MYGQYYTVYFITILYQTPSELVLKNIWLFQFWLMINESATTFCTNFFYRNISVFFKTFFFLENYLKGQKNREGEREWEVGRDREWERENTPKWAQQSSWAPGPDQSQEPGNHPGLPCQGQEPKRWALTCCLRGHVIGRSWNQKCSLGSGPILRGDGGTPSGI